MELVINRDFLIKIESIIKKNNPIESCGILSGIIKENYYIRCIRELKNILKSDKAFWFSYKEWIQKIMECKKMGYQYIGLFHSHNRDEALLSLSDRQRMLECPGEVWMIVAYSKGKVRDIQAWVIKGYNEPLEKLDIISKD